jgi:plastocyanin
MTERVVVAVLVLGAGAVGLAVPPLVGAATPTASVTIRHQVRGCHTWSVNGGPFAASRAVTLARSGSIRFTNNDVMPHTLIKVSGPAVRMRNGNTMPMGMGKHGAAAPGVMNHMGATTTVSFSRAGRYVFKTQAGEDYMPGVRTVGEDNVLRLTVKVR